MTLEKLAIMGIVIFAFMAFIKMVSSVREAKKSARKRAVSKRPRRQVGSEASAKQIANGLVGEVAGSHPELAAKAAQTGTIPPKLDKALEKAMDHYRERVSSKFRGLFHLSVNEIILKKPTP